jgi:omega-6 fatty acid desaturase (delta-12 desaturase)
LGHNLAHHGFTNLRGRDTVWTPLDAEEFNRLSRVNQWLQKAYRSGWGVGLYYLVELWWDKLVFPPTSRGGGKRAVFARDRSLVAAFALCWIGVVALGASTFESSVAAAIVFGVLLPFTIWNCLMGFVIYVHHTAPEVVWYDDGAQWSAAMPYCTATIHVEAPWMDALLHRILQHPAHHVDMTIPFYRLRAAQALLASIAPKEIRTVSLTWRYYWDVARCCKLYDYRTRQWQPFETRPRRTTVSSVA